MTTVYTEADTCVICGSYVPEGRMVCKACEEDPFRMIKNRSEG